MREVYEKYRGFNIFVEQDDNCGDGPRDWDNLGTMVCFHSRYMLGDTGGKHRKLQRGVPHFDNPLDFKEWMQHKDAVVLPLILAEHGNMWMSTTRACYPFNCPWDSGQVGWIYVLHWQIKKEYGEVNDDAIANAARCLIGEVETYSQYISGEVYGYIVQGLANDVLASCWGYYGAPEVSGLLDDARGAIDWYIAKAYKRRAEQVKAWIRNRVPHIYRTPMGLTASL